MSKRIPSGKYTQSNQHKDICILLVNDDDICKNIVAYMLDNCRYEAFSYKREMDAVNIIQQKKDVTELILTNVRRTYAKRYGIIEHIEKKIKLQIIFMPPDVDDEDASSTIGVKGVTVYYMKCLSVNDMNNLFATALAQEKSKKELLSKKLLVKENEGSKRMRDDDDDDDQHGNEEKKPRVVWTKELHRKFLEAVAQLGDDKAFPKKIVELMNVPGLSRANVASHLQKHRCCMKRAQERFTGSSYDFTDNFGYKTLQENNNRFHWNPFQIGSKNTNTTIFQSFHLNHNTSRSRTPQRLSLLKTIQLKPDHNFRVYGDETKNFLLRSIKENSNRNFAGFKFSSDGKSVVFGQNSQLAASSSPSSSLSLLSVHQQKPLFPEMRNDDSTLWSPVLDSFTPKESTVTINSQLSSLADLLAVRNDDSTLWSPVLDSFTPKESTVSISSQLSSLADILAVNEPMPAVITQPQASSAPTCPDWNQKLQSEETANGNFDVFDDFTSTYTPLKLCELGVETDDIGVVDATAISDFDYLLFDDPELT